MEAGRNFHYFYEISRIPRGSFHEERIADYIEQFARDRGLEVQRDSLHNLIIKKPGSLGREQEPPLMLQAHTDMVCAKEPWSEHDFTRDPIDIREEDGWLTANGTTLGADDGAGVANILALLDEPDLSHPPLECVFTVQEEDGMGGAKGLDMSGLESRRMIGLDGIQEGTTIYSASAVRGCKFRGEFPRDSAPAGAMYRLRVSGLTSGHGALMIGAERANAIKVAARLLRRLSQVCGIRLAELRGGGLIHVIPRECAAVFTAEAGLETLREAISDLTRQIRLEYGETDPEMEVTLERAEAEEPFCLTAADTARLVTFLCLLPVGAWKRTAGNLAQVEGSFNLSVLRLEGGALACDLVCRSNYPVSIDELWQVAVTYGETFGLRCEVSMDYAGYHVPQDSPLIRLWAEVYKRDTGRELGLTYMHSALDAGTICERLGIQDMIVMMPTTLEVHTPRERMNIDSFRRTYGYLKEILARA